MGEREARARGGGGTGLGSPPGSSAAAKDGPRPTRVLGGVLAALVGAVACLLVLLVVFVWGFVSGFAYGVEAVPRNLTAVEVIGVDAGGRVAPAEMGQLAGVPIGGGRAVDAGAGGVGAEGGAAARGVVPALIGAAHIHVHVLGEAGLEELGGGGAAGDLPPSLVFVPFSCDLLGSEHGVPTSVAELAAAPRLRDFLSHAGSSSASARAPSPKLLTCCAPGAPASPAHPRWTLCAPTRAHCGSLCRSLSAAASADSKWWRSLLRVAGTSPPRVAHGGGHRADS